MSELIINKDTHFLLMTHHAFFLSEHKIYYFEILKKKWREKERINLVFIIAEHEGKEAGY